MCFYCIPDGTLQSVINTPFNFNNYKQIGKEINNKKDTQILNGNGYDHNFVINRKENEINKLIECTNVYSLYSGINLSIYTTEPGVQFYTGNYLDSKLYYNKNKNLIFGKRGAFCLETQHFPDSPNQKTFPSTVYDKDKPFNSQTEFRFSIYNE